MKLREMCCKLIMQVSVLLAIAIADATTVLAAAKAISDCSDHCGDVEIPYPFGTSPGCFRNEDFLITCDNSAVPSNPKAFLTKSNISVTNITIDDGRLYVRTFPARDCYDENGSRVDKHRSLLSLSKFTISNTQNKFTVIGCDSYAYIRGYIGAERYRAGCMSLCDNASNIKNGSCIGTGCCQIEIPRGLKLITISTYSFYNHTNVSSFNPCTYAFLVDQTKFKFSSEYLSDLNEDFPMVLDWAINGTCTQEASNSSSLSNVCGENAFCFTNDSITYGYRCHCNKGYRGNPYLPNGCQDIDECSENLHKCDNSTSICANENGTYTCPCREGYHIMKGNDGKFCIADQFRPADQFPFVKVAMGVGIFIVVLIVSSSWLYLVLKQRNLIKIKEKFFQQNGGLLLQQQISKRNGSSDTVKIFRAEELKKATNNYAEDRIVGRGGHGTVFLGFLTDNTAVAIKKSKIVDQSQVEQFINEVVVLSQINHRNVVRLLGCCLETEVPLLVYEFVSNGTLFEHIHNKEKLPTISWEIRLRIAAETAEVLSYLHSAASTPIIHRDVKSTNILLDDNYTAKVSDFGASKLVPMDKTQLYTMVQGTLGYLDPEYLQTSQLTEKSDVYSFGVVLVELLTGKKALLFDKPEEDRSLVKYFLSSLKENNFFEILENHIVNYENKEQLKEVVNLAERCLRVKGEERPTMREVAMELEGLRMMQTHLLDNAESETIPLLSETSDAYEFGPDGSNSTTAGYDSIKDQVLVAFDDGR